MMARRTTFIAVAIGVALARPAAAIDIVSPARDTVVAAGGTVTIVVAPSAGETITDVAVTSGVSAVRGTPRTNPPGAFEATVHVPLDRVGSFFIGAVATLSTGDPAFDYVRIQVDPGALDTLAASAPLVMSTIGQVVQVGVKGMFADGVRRDLSDPDTGTTYTSSNTTVLGVDPSGLIQARTAGTSTVQVSNRGKTAFVIVRVAVPDPPNNHIPVPNPGADQTVAHDTVVILSGAASTDADGDTLQYRWQQLSGRIVVLRDENTFEPSFVSPHVDAADVLEFSLVVIDSHGATSLPARVRITVTP
jgi:hypothetical protein